MRSGSQIFGAPSTREASIHPLALQPTILTTSGIVTSYAHGIAVNVNRLIASPFCFIVVAQVKVHWSTKVAAAAEAWADHRRSRHHLEPKCHLNSSERTIRLVTSALQFTMNVRIAMRKPY